MMEEELAYSTVVFKNNVRPPKETDEDSTVYSTVKTEKGIANTAPKDDEAAAHSHHSVCLLVVCLGILCVLALVSISAIIYIRVIMNEQKANFEAKLDNLTVENQQLITERGALEKQTDNLNWMLGVILQFNTFPVNEYCPQKQCQPCRDGWILFQEKCYLFYNKPAPWKTWTDSWQYCQTASADLVVIDSLQEQTFVSNHTEYYFDQYHGYWLGLNLTAGNNWRWVDGHNDTRGYWMSEKLDTPVQCAMIIPQRNYTTNWKPAECLMQNKFICESDVLIRSNYLA